GTIVDSRNTININQLNKWKRNSKLISILIIILVLLLFLGVPAFRWLVQYIWMDTLGFGNVFTTILSSKISLVICGFLLFSLFTYITLFWIRHSYLKHFSEAQLPRMVLNRKGSQMIMLATSFFIGLFGSSIIQGIGWEPTLKLLNYASFGLTDPYFNMDISFYLFVYPFVQLIIYILLGLTIFF